MFRSADACKRGHRYAQTLPVGTLSKVTSRSSNQRHPHARQCLFTRSHERPSLSLDCVSLSHKPAPAPVRLFPSPRDPRPLSRFLTPKKLKGSRENAVVIEPAFSWASDSFAGRTSVTMEAENGNVTRDLHAELQKSTEVTVAVAVIRTLTRAIERSTATTVMGLEKVSDTKSFELQPYCATCAASLWRPEDFLHCGGVPCLSLLPSRIFFPPFALPETDPALPLCSPTLGRTQRTCTHPQRS